MAHRGGIQPSSCRGPELRRRPYLARLPPPSHTSGRKWRIGYVGSGEYEEYPRTLYAIARALQQLGWLRIDDMPEITDMRKAWLYLATHARSNYIEFVPDAWWQPGNFDTALRPAVREAVAARLRGAKDIDLIIAMGTWAGQDMVELGTPVPTVVVSSTDPISARIIPSAADSGQDNLHARVQPDHYQRQIQLLHDIVPFKTLDWSTKTPKQVAPTQPSIRSPH